MSEDKLNRLERVARNLKAVACIIDSGKKIAVAGVVVAGLGVGTFLGVKAYNAVTDIADMPGEMLSTAKGGLRSAWDHTGGAAISFGKGLFKSDEEEADAEIQIAQSETVDTAITAEVPASHVEMATPDNVEVTIEPEILDEPDDGKGWGLCVKFWSCNKDPEAEEADPATDIEVVPEDLAPAID